MPSRCVGFNTVLPWLSRKQKEPDERGEKNLSGKSVARHSFPLTGKDKGRGDGFDRFLSTPITAFPHQGEGWRVRCSDVPPFSSLSRVSVSYDTLRGAKVLRGVAGS